MKKFLSIVLVVLLTPLMVSGQPSWDTEGVKVNPTANTVLATTGLLPGQFAGAFWTIIISSSVLTLVVIEELNNVGAVVKSQAIFLPAGGSYTLHIMFGWDNETELRLRLNNTIVGSVQGSLIRE